MCIINKAEFKQYEMLWSEKYFWQSGKLTQATDSLPQNQSWKNKMRGSSLQELFEVQAVSPLKYLELILAPSL